MVFPGESLSANYIETDYPQRTIGAGNGAEGDMPSAIQMKCLPAPDRYVRKRTDTSLQMGKHRSLRRFDGVNARIDAMRREPYFGAGSHRKARLP